MEKTYLKKFISYAAATAIAVSALTVASPARATTTLDATNTTLDFSNTETIYKGVGESQLYENIATLEGQAIDAVVTVIASFDDADMYDLDYFDNENPSPIVTPLDIDLDIYGDKGSYSFSIEFFLHGTDTQVTLENLDLNVKDIDTYQYIETENVSGYAFSQDTALTALTHDDNAEVAVNHTRFQELNGEESERSDQPFWVSIHFNSITTFNFKVGQDTEGGAWFSLDFSKAAFDNPDNHGDTGTPAVVSKLTKTVFFTGDSAYLQPKWFKSLDKLIAKVPTCATNVTAKIYSGVKKAKSEVKGNDLAQRRAAILKKFLNKRGLATTITLVPNGKGTKALNKKRYAKVVIKYTSCN
ncbi:MAG: hypothetical protein RLZZ330_397 [Actinomycetota bacterium]|jgi:hypothetical protein